MGAKVARGENLRCGVKIRNFSKVLVNATAIDLTISDKNGVTIVTKTLLDIVQLGTGLYAYDYTPASDALLGTNCALWDVTYSTLHRKARGYFTVVA